MAKQGAKQGAKDKLADANRFHGIRKGVGNAPEPDLGGEIKGGNVEKWEEGMEVGGIFIEMKEIETDLGKGSIFTLEFGDRTRKTFGAPAMLAPKLAQVGVGVDVVIRCLGKVSNKRNLPEWQFKVWEAGRPQADPTF